MGHICSARNWCELLGFPSPFVPGTSIAVCSIGLRTVPVVRDYFTRPRPHPRPIFLSTGFLLFIDNQPFPTHHLSCPSFGRYLDLGNFIAYPLRIL